MNETSSLGSISSWRERLRNRLSLGCVKKDEKNSSTGRKAGGNMTLDSKEHNNGKLRLISEDGNSSGKGFINSGVHNLDYFLGGGFPVGSLNLIDQDEFAIYTHTLMKCLVANQLLSRIRVDLFADYTMATNREYVEKLPKKKSVSLSKIQNNGDMKIAWRYNNLPNLQSVSSNGTHFDLGTRLDEEEITSHDMLSNFNFYKTSNIAELMKLVSSTSDYKPPRVLVVENLHYLAEDQKDAFGRLYWLKSLTRKHPNMTIFVRMNGQLVSNAVRNYLFNIADSVLQIESINPEKSIYKDFSAIVKVHKLPKLNCMNYLTSTETLDIGIEMLKNNHFMLVQQLSLPPDVSETASRSTSSCSSTKIDF